MEIPSYLESITEKSESEDSIEEEEKDDNFKEIEMISDGNSLFSVVAHQVFGHQKRHALVRT